MNESKIIFNRLVQLATEKQNLPCFFIVSAYTGLNDMLSLLVSHQLSFNQSVLPSINPELASNIHIKAYGLFNICIRSQETVLYFLETMSFDYLYFIGSLLVGVLSRLKKRSFDSFFGLFSQLPHGESLLMAPCKTEQVDIICDYLTLLYLKMFEMNKGYLPLFCCAQVAYFQGNFQKSLSFYSDGFAILSRHFMKISSIQELIKEHPTCFLEMIDSCGKVGRKFLILLNF